MLDPQKRQDGHRQHSCIYCETLVWKISRHMERCHKNEQDVASALSNPVKSKERRNAWAKLTRQGDFKRNIDVLKKHSGKIIVAREVKNSSPEDYVTCTACNGFFYARHF